MIRTSVLKRFHQYVLDLQIKECRPSSLLRPIASFVVRTISNLIEFQGDFAGIIADSPEGAGCSYESS
jgi:hypothetical protein